MAISQSSQPHRSSGPNGARLRRASLSERQLLGFLNARVGLPWAEVPDAFKAHFKLDAQEAASLFRKLDVATRTVLRDGKVRVQLDSMPNAALADVPHAFYVEPGTKLLRVNEPRALKLVAQAQERARQEAVAQAQRRELSDSLQAHKRGQSWVVVELKPFGGSAFDVLLGRNVSAADARDLQRVYGRSGVYAAQKRELTYREQHQLGLG